MNITMTITADNTAELFASIKDAAALLQCTASENIAPPAASAVLAPVSPVAPVIPPQMPSTPAPVVPLATAPSYTLDQIAKAGAELAQSGKMPDLLVLLQQFGVQAVTQLKPEQLGPFATALRGLGAQL